MRHKSAERFWIHYDKLPAEVQSLAMKQFVLLKRDPFHPSLHFKRVRKRAGQEVWSARVTSQYRALAFQRPYGFFWFWIGQHSEYDKLI